MHCASCRTRQSAGMDAVSVCREYQPDVIVLDIMLSDIDSIEVCRQIWEFLLSVKNIDQRRHLTAWQAMVKI